MPPAAAAPTTLPESARAASPGSMAALQHGQERCALPSKPYVQPLRHCGPQIRKGRPFTERHRMHRLAKGEQRYAFPCMIGRGSRRIVAVVGGNEEQVILAQYRSD